MSAIVQYQDEGNSYFSKTTNFCKETFNSENPTWKLGLLKSSVGLAGLCYSNIYTGSYLDLVGELLCSGLFVSGINDLGSLAYSSLEKRAINQITKNKKNKTATHIKRAELNKTAAKLKKAVKLTAYIGMSLNCLYNYEGLGKLGSLNVNPFTSITEAPNSLVQGFQISVCALSILMNLMELTEIKGENFLLNNPISEIVNNMVMLSFFTNKKDIVPFIEYNKMDRTQLLAELKNQLGVLLSELEEQMEVLSHVQAMNGIPSLNSIETLKFYYFRRITRNSLEISSLQNLFSLFNKNITNYKTENTRFKKINSTSSPNHLPHINQPKPITKRLAEPSTKLDIDYPLFDNVSSSKEKEAPLKKIKKKTKGIADKHKQTLENSKNDKLQSTSSISLTTDLRKAKREKALERLADLRKLHPVKETVIAKEIRKALKFAKAEVNGAGKGVFSIKWETDKGSHSLNYEEPHGIDSSNYKGNRLDRVLNVLFTIYISDLNEEQASMYITKYNPSLFNFNFIKYLFFNRS